MPDPNRHADARIEAEASAHVYQNRWQRVLLSVTLQEFDAQTVEAEALVGRRYSRAGQPDARNLSTDRSSFGT